MRYIVSMLSVLVVLFCNDVSAISVEYCRTSKRELPVKENFDQFFKKYNSDKAFQIARTVFPLKMQIVDEEQVVTNKLLPRSKWKHVNLLGKNYIIKKTPHGNDQMIVSLQIEDTGIFVEHVFKLYNGSWRLTSITDSST